MIKIAITVEDNCSDTNSLSLLCENFTNFGGLLFLRHFLKTKRRCRCDGITGQIINYLCIDLLVATEDAQTRTLGSSVYALTNSLLYLNSSFNFLCCHNSLILEYINL